MLVYVKLLFSFALTHNYPPEGRSTAAEQLKKVKAQSGEMEIYTPGQFTKILHAAPPHLIPLLAIGGFSGIRMAELARLDWNAVDLERRHIEVRAGQAKTALRRLIPIPDNLIQWLTIYLPCLSGGAAAGWHLTAVRPARWLAQGRRTRLNCLNQHRGCQCYRQN
jgi:integrase